MLSRGLLRVDQGVEADRGTRRGEMSCGKTVYFVTDFDDGRVTSDG